LRSAKKERERKLILKNEKKGFSFGSNVLRKSDFARDCQGEKGGRRICLFLMRVRTLQPVSEKTIKPLQSTGVLGGEKFLVRTSFLV
jgi:hypothetical protein